MLKPTSALVYVFQDASDSGEGAWVALMVGAAVGDFGLSANELHDAKTMTSKMKTMVRFITS